MKSGIKSVGLLLLVFGLLCALLTACVLSPSRLVGKWQLVDDDICYEFFSNGTAILSDGEDKVGCTYTAEGDQLQIISQTEVFAFDYEIHGNTLYISRGGVIFKLERVD